MSDDIEKAQTDILKGMIRLEAIESKIDKPSPADLAILAIQRESMKLVSEALRHQRKDENYAYGIKMEIATRLNQILTTFLQS